MKEVSGLNIVFWFLVVVALVAAWFALRFCFKNFGEFFIDLFGDTKDAINDENNTNEEE